MRRALWLLPAFLLCAIGLPAEEPAPALQYPIWDNQEPVAEYAQRVGLSPTKTLDLGDGVKLELVLIPAGKFIMGTPKPAPVDEEGFHNKIVMGKALLALGGGVLLVLLCAIVIQAIQKRQRPKFTLARLLGMTVAAGVAVLSGMHWRQSVQMMEMAAAEYQAAKARYEDANADEKPWHLVTLAQPFYMGKYEVTQEQYAQLIGSNPSYIKGQPLPISNVSWDDTQEFFKKLTAQTKQSIRLPTEAEWEYSCRAGTRTKYYSGDTEADLARVAWHGVNSKETAQPVGQKEPSVFGLFDMHGNLWEWCQDWYEEDYYSHSPAQDPQGLTQGNYRVLRGGSWHYDPGSCRAAYRFKHPPNERMSYYGFRVRMNASKSP